MKFTPLFLLITYFNQTSFSCSSDEKYGGGSAGHQAYLNWLASQNLDVQFANNNNKMITQTSDFFDNKTKDANNQQSPSQKSQPYSDKPKQGNERNYNNSFSNSYQKEISETQTNNKPETEELVPSPAVLELRNKFNVATQPQQPKQDDLKFIKSMQNWITNGLPKNRASDEVPENNTATTDPTTPGNNESNSIAGDVSPLSQPIPSTDNNLSYSQNSLPRSVNPVPLTKRKLTASGSKKGASGPSNASERLIGGLGLSPK